MTGPSADPDRPDPDRPDVAERATVTGDSDAAGPTGDDATGADLTGDDSADADTPAGGTYVLLVVLPSPTTLEVGALGECRLPAGAYGYVGSALGSGGFARVDRHRELAAGERDVRHWHVDALLGHPDATLADAVELPGAAVECALARTLADGDPPIPGFGASDCDCPAHLVRRDDPDELRNAVDDAARTALASE